MVTVGSLSWTAKVERAGRTQRKVDNLSEGFESAETQANAANNAFGGTEGKLKGVSDASDRANNRFGRLSGMTAILRSAIFFLGATVGSLILRLTGLSAIAGLLSRGISTLIGWLTGAWAAIGGLSGIVATLSGWLSKAAGLASGFVSWLLAGSAGALAFAAAIGAAIGLVGVWILKVTGALDAVKNFGAWVKGILPGWVRDGILAVIGIFAGPLAVIGGFISGFIEGGFQEGLRRARQVLDILLGAIWRTVSRIGGAFIRAGQLLWSGIQSGVDMAIDAIQGVIEWIQKAIDKIINLAQRAANLPDEAGAGAARAAGIHDEGQEGFLNIKGSPIDVPFVQSGGVVRESGVAVVHKGERVLNTGERAALESGGGGVRIENVDVEIGDQSLDISNLSRLEMEDLASLIAEELGTEVEGIIG